MRTSYIIWSILYIGVWVWTIDKLINGNMDWFEYMSPVIMMTFTNPWFFKKKK